MEYVYVVNIVKLGSRLTEKKNSDYFSFKEEMFSFVCNVNI